MHKLGVKQNHMSWPNMYYGVGLLGESGLKKKRQFNFVYWQLAFFDICTRNISKAMGKYCTLHFFNSDSILTYALCAYNSGQHFLSGERVLYGAIASWEGNNVIMKLYL